MGNTLKYSTSQPTKNGLMRGNLVLGTGDSDYGPTSTSGYVNGLNFHEEGGWVIYTLGANNNPIGWVAMDDEELFAVSFTLGGVGTQISDAGDAVAYICGLANTWIMDRIPSNMVTDELVYYSDASNLSSYPGKGSNLMDLSGDGRDATTANDPTINSSGTGLVFDGVDTEVNIPAFTLSGDFSVTQTLNLSNTSPRYGGMPLGGGHRNPSGTDRRAYMWFRGDYNEFRFTVNQEQQKVLSVDSALWEDKTIQYTAIRDGSNVRFYINGGEVATATGMDSRTITFRQIGASYNYPYYNVDGTIFNTAIYDKALSVSEVQQNYYGGNIVTSNLILALDAANPVCFEPGDTTCKNLVTGGNISGASGTPYSGTNTPNPSNFPVYNSTNGGVFDFVGGKGMNCDEDLGQSTTRTLQMWVYKNSSDVQYISDARNNGGQWFLSNYTSNNITYTNQLTYDFNNPYNANSPEFINQWLCLTVTSDDDGSNLWINGTKIVSGATSIDEDFGKNFRIGTRFTTSHQWTGYFGPILAYDRVLTQSEIIQNFRAQQARFS